MNSFTPMADIMKILQQAQQMQGRLQQIQEELGNMTVTGVSGGGMVSVIADGKGQVRSVKLDPSVVNPTDIEMLEDLIAVAVADAQKKATDIAQEEMRKLTPGLPPNFKLPF
jgi:DNA-binding YbaB/EbfC family protein